MKTKRGLNIIILVTILLLITLIIAEDFDPNNPDTWTTLTPEQFNSITAENLNNAFTTNPNAVIDNWKNFHPRARNDFTNELLKQKTNTFLKLENFGSNELTLMQDKIIGPNGQVVEFENLPFGLKGIKYNEEKKAFIYDFGDGKEVELGKGGYGKEGFYGTETPLDGTKVRFSTNDGKFSYNSETQTAILENGAELIKSTEDGETITYRQNDETNPATVQLIADTRAITTNTIATKSNNGIITSYDIPTLNIFDDYPVNDLETFPALNNIPFDSNQYARIGTTEAESVGKNIDLETYKPLDKMSFNGENLKFINGDVEIIADGRELKFPRTVKPAPFTIKELTNEQDPNKNTFRIQNFNEVVKIKGGVEDINSLKPENIELVLEPTDKNGNAGSSLIHTGGALAIGQIKGVELGREYGSVTTGLDADYLDTLPTGISTLEEFTKAIENTNGKLMNIKTNIDIGVEDVIDAMNNKPSTPTTENPEPMTTEQVTNIIGEAYSATNFAIKYKSELIDLTRAISGSTKKGVAGTIDDNTVIKFDSRSGSVKFEVPIKTASGSTIMTTTNQFNYPPEFVDGIITTVINKNPRLVEIGWTAYKRKYNIQE